MIKIEVTTTPWEHQINTCTFSSTIEDESTCTHALSMFIKALQLAGYQEESIRGALEELEFEMYESIESAHKVMTERREI